MARCLFLLWVDLIVFELFTTIQISFWQNSNKNKRLGYENSFTMSQNLHNQLGTDVRSVTEIMKKALNVQSLRVACKILFFFPSLYPVSKFQIKSITVKSSLPIPSQFLESHLNKILNPSKILVPYQFFQLPNTVFSLNFK